MANNSSVLCILNPTPSLYCEIAASLAFLPVNFFLLLCLFYGRNKLKVRLVSKYCFNVVLAAFVASVARSVDTLTRLNSNPWMPRSFPSNQEFGVGLYYFRLIEKTAIVYMFLVLFGTFLLVTLALRENLLGESATVAGVARRDEEDKEDVSHQLSLCCKIFQKGLKEHAEIYIALNWFFPFVVLFISSATYDCSKAYVCPFEYVPEDKLVENAGPGCSADIPTVSTQTMNAATVVWVVTLCFILGSQASCFVTYRRISANVPQKQRQTCVCSSNETTATKGSDSSSTDDKSLLLEKIRKDLTTIFIISVVYTCATFGSGLLAILANVNNWHLTREERYYTIVFILLPILAETFSSIYLCVNIYPVNSALRWAITRIFKRLACR